MAKPQNIARTEQTEYGPVYIDDDSGFAFRGPEYTPRYQSLVRAGIDPGWERLPDGWYKSGKKAQQPSVIRREIRNTTAAVVPSMNAAALLFGAGAAVLFLLKKR